MGSKDKHYIYGVDPASEVDNFSIVVLEVSDHRRIVHCWTTTSSEHKEKVKKGYSSESDFYSYCARKIRDSDEALSVYPYCYGRSRWWSSSYGIVARQR